MDFIINQIFENDYQPEAAIWCNENKAYIKQIEQIEGVRRFQIKAIPEPSLDDLKEHKLSQLESAFLDYRTSKNTWTQSSLGFKVNANSMAYMDVDGLVGILNSRRVSGQENPTIAFMDFDNLPHDLTQDQLTTIKNEISMNGTRAYAVKWDLRQKIQTASSKEELDGIKIGFSLESESPQIMGLSVGLRKVGL